MHAAPSAITSDTTTERRAKSLGEHIRLVGAVLLVRRCCGHGGCVDAWFMSVPVHACAWRGGGAQVEALFERVDEELGTLTALVNNAVRPARCPHLHCTQLPDRRRVCVHGVYAASRCRQAGRRAVR